MLNAISLAILVLSFISPPCHPDTLAAVGKAGTTYESAAAAEVTAGTAWVTQASDPEWLGSRFDALWGTADNGNQFVYLITPATGSFLIFQATIRNGKAYIGNPNSEYVVLGLIPGPISRD